MKLTDETFLQFAFKNYDNIQCLTVEEFEEDLKRFTYVKKLFYRYKYNNDLCERIILNHLIVLFNVFGSEATKMLFFKMETELWNYLATFLIYLQRMPDSIPEFNIISSEISLDKMIIDKLRLL
jgi:hypothetical protein